MAEEVAESYKSSLDDLEFNSKPQISMLTMLAEDHEQYASEIVRVIEEQIKKVQICLKLPILYLLDSIIKNLSTTKYPQLFAQSIVQIFCGVFEEVVDEKTRQAMYKLRQTWVDIIPNKQLYLLDRKVQLLDPAWPITAKAPEHGVIHVNPKFLKQNQKEEERSPQFSPAHSETSHEDVKDELYAKEKELQALRFKLELAETKNKLKKQLQLEEQAILSLKSSKKVIDREPPSVIKLPPANTSPVRGSQLPSRDPRISRGPVMNRDPRLIKQMERQEQERQEKEKLKVAEAEALVSTKPVIDANLESGERSTSDLPENVPSQRMDLASLLTSFTVAAQKVAAENKKKSVSSQPPSKTENSVQKKSDTKLKSTESLKQPQKKNDVQIAAKDSKEDSKYDKKHSSSDKESPSKTKEKINDSKKLKVIKPKRDELTDTKEKESKENIENNEVARQDTKEKRDNSDRKEIGDRVRRESDRRDSKDKERSESKEKDRRERKEKDRRDSKEKDRRDSKEKDRRNSKEKDRRESKDRSRRESKDRGRRESKDKRDIKDTRDRKDSSERRSDSDINQHSPRRGYGRHSPPDHGHSYRDNRPNRPRGREKPRLPEPVIHSSDGKTDQFGRMLRTSRSDSSSRDRSPIDREKDAIAETSMDLEGTLKSDDSESDKTIAKLSDQGTATLEQAIVEQGVVLTDQLNNTGEKVCDLSLAEVSDINEDKRKTELNKLEDGTSAEDTSMEVEESSEQVMEMDEESGEDNKNNELTSDTTEDVDMRIPRPSAEVIKESLVNDESEDSLNDSIDSVIRLKRPSSEADDIKSEVRPYKIPKLAASRKQESKREDSQEDISKLFGEEDVDYRHQVPKSLLAPPPMPVQNLLSPSPSALKSPAQRRWSQFKESHPDDFAQDMERKRLRDAQMQSMVTDVQDVDFRLLTSSRQRSLPLPPLDPSIPIPKDLSAENQEQILQRAEQELKEGRISHGDHQEIVRQLGQVYDIQKKRSNLEERSVKSLDLRDPRLRGIRETRGSFAEDVDRRGSYREEIDMHKKTLLPTLPLSGDMPDESASNSPRYRDRRDNYHVGYESSGKEDYDARRPARGVSRHDRRLGPEFSRRRDYDLRSPGNYDIENSLSPRDFDDHIHSRYRDFDGRPRRDIDDYDDRSQDFDARRPRDEEEHHRDYRASDRRTSFDEFNEGSHNLRREDMRPLPIRDPRHDDIRERRRNTPPQEGPFRGLTDDAPGPRPYGLIDDAQGPRPYGMPDIAQSSRSYGPPRHLPPDVRGPRPNFSGPVIRPHGPRSLGPDGPRPVGLMQGPVGVLNANSRISDPMDDPRWSVMRGLLDHEGTEELVIDGKPFELRMGTSRKLRVYGKVMDVAVDLKERGIRIDNQLVYKLGEPIKEVPAVGRSVRLYYHGLPKPIWLDGQQHEMRMDAPPRNVMVDGVRRGFQIDGRDMMILVDRLEKGHYGGPPRKIRIAGIEHDIAFQAPPRRILIDNKSCELKLDSKIPYVVINGKPHGIRFDGEPRTVFINEQPFTIPVDRAEKIRIGSRPTYIAFGGPAHEIIIDGKWFEVKFDNVPKDIHLGNRHFSIRIPGPLPRVKILEELPPNFDESCLMSSNQLMVPQPGQPPRMPMTPRSESNAPISITQHEQFPLGPIRVQGQNNMHVQGLPSADSMPGSSGPEPVLPVTPLATDGVRPNNSQASEGIMRPVGPIAADVRFSQPQIQNIPQPNQPIIAQPGPTMLQQSNPILHGQLPNPLLGLQRPNLMGFGVNQPGLPRHQPVNLIAQGLLNQVASSMISNQFSNMQGLPDFAAGLRVLSQMTSHVQPHMQTQLTPQVHQTVPIQKPQEDDHGAVMVTGMQGSAFGGHQIKFGKPLATNMQISNAPVQQTATGLSNLLGIVSSATATSTNNSISTSTDTSSTDVSSAPKPPIDINSLLNNLLKAGLIKESSKGETTLATEVEKKSPVNFVAEEPKGVQPIKKINIPDLADFAPEKLKRAYASVIEQLHEGIQCHTCAARFTMSDHEKYRAHLDWHFRQNKMEQEMVKVAKNRKWFYSIPDWIQYEELEDTEEKSRSEIFEQMRPNDEKPIVAGQTISLRALEGKDVIKNPVATGIEGEDVCATCGDPFDQMWNEETEEWILKNTIKVDGKTYHPVCYEDAQETPTPIIAPTSNPLDAQIAGNQEVTLEPTENSDPVAALEVKKEPMETDESTDKDIVNEAAETLVKKEIEETCEEVLDTDSKLPVSEEDKNVDPSPEPNKIDILLSQAPTLLSTITTTVVREVIPVSHEDPMSPWEMDSNPTPELSRTPTPETIPSFTPALSLSSESLASIPQAPEVMISEDPIPPPVDTISSATDIDDKPLKATEISVPPPVKVIKIEPYTGL
ncbi:unnamed protein product [Lymnaea stagnalis]|uniref:CID domain-containing protein n=1 Tax=Lymnaea stagnalis TaxID=6523 RepID=A0AAV2I554_LYMST